MFIQLLAQTMYFQLLPSHVFSAFAQPGVPNQRAAGAFFFRKKGHPWIFDYVNSGNCQNCQNFNIYGFGDLSKKTRAEKS